MIVPLSIVVFFRMKVRDPAGETRSRATGPLFALPKVKRLFELSVWWCDGWRPVNRAAQQEGQAKGAVVRWRALTYVEW
jgi:hypothetical protein